MAYNLKVRDRVNNTWLDIVFGSRRPTTEMQVKIAELESAATEHEEILAGIQAQEVSE